MLRGFRHIFIVLAGWLSLANAQVPTTQPQHPNAEASQGQIALTAAAPTNVVEPFEPAEFFRACEDGEPNYNSELCAQWKTADAAAKAADWAKIGTLVGGASGVLVLIALGLAYQANGIARDTAKRQLRAYLYVELKEVPKLEIGGSPEGQLWLKNGGQTPAHNVRLASAFIVGKYPFVGEPAPIPEDAYQGGGHLAPDCPTVLTCKAPEEEGITQPWIDAIKKGSWRVVMYGEIRYEDIFGDSHFTRYRAEYGGPETVDLDCVIWSHSGNEAD